MTREKLTSVFEFYRQHLADNYMTVCMRAETGWGWNHLHWMCNECILVLIPGGKIEKAMRWLGFIQGVLFERDAFTLTELKNHSRPDEVKECDTIGNVSSHSTSFSQLPSDHV